MKKPCFILAALALGIILVAGCQTANTSNNAWGKTAPEDNRPGYQSADAPPVNSDSRQ